MTSLYVEIESKCSLGQEDASEDPAYIAADCLHVGMVSNVPVLLVVNEPVLVGDIDKLGWDRNRYVGGEC